ncbi:hypothetical protein OPQ81_006225 [Rhizoctonia solani]|nr:hypothetical protein OPQ81_006225 [Rhizoctonia solani]
MDSRQYELFQKSVVVADRALQAVAGFDVPTDKKIRGEKLQEQLDEAILELVGYWGDLSGFDEDYDPIVLMLNARNADQAKWSIIMPVNDRKKILKSGVDFFIHDGRGAHLLIRYRDPSIHILFVTKMWSRLYSLAGLIDNETVIVLKGVDGTLYHAQQVIEQLTHSGSSPQHYQIHRIDRQSGIGTRAPFFGTQSNGTSILFEAREFICREEKRRPENRWLVEISSGLLDNEPTFDNWAKRPKIRYKPGSEIVLTRPSPPTGSVTTGLTQATSQGSRATGGSGATAHVKLMLAQLERKENENRGKETKGLFARIHDVSLEEDYGLVGCYPVSKLWFG